MDGQRQPVQVISPCAVQSNAVADHTTYTEASIDRTIEQILGMTPMTQLDLVASPMTTAFTNAANLAPHDHLAPTIALNTFPQNKGAANALPGAWNLALDAMFRGHIDKADSLDANTLNHLIWYASTGFVRPYPGEATVMMPSDLKPAAKSAASDD